MNKTQASISPCLSVGTTSLVWGGDGRFKGSSSWEHYQNLGCLFE